MNFFIEGARLLTILKTVLKFVNKIRESKLSTLYLRKILQWW